MFNLFGRKTVKDFEAEAKETYYVPEIKPIDVPKEPKENYRVGCTADGMTTLTLMDNALTMTLTLNQTGCEQLIRMLESTFIDERTQCQL
jgi:hypothetical protein